LSRSEALKTCLSHVHPQHYQVGPFPRHIPHCSLTVLPSVFLCLRVAFHYISLQLRRLVAGFPLRRPVFDHKSSHVGFVMDNAALGKVFCKYFGFPCQFSLNYLLRTHRLSSGAATTGQTVADVPSGLSLTPKLN
jgi:hypothetical protein